LNQKHPILLNQKHPILLNQQHLNQQQKLSLEMTIKTDCHCGFILCII
jgi:hypothetical protein